MASFYIHPCALVQSNDVKTDRTEVRVVLARPARTHPRRIYHLTAGPARQSRSTARRHTITERTAHEFIHTAVEGSLVDEADPLFRTDATSVGWSGTRST